MNYRIINGELEILPQTATPPALSWSSLSPAQRKYARQLWLDEGWSKREAIQLAFYDGGAQ